MVKNILSFNFNFMFTLCEIPGGIKTSLSSEDEIGVSENLICHDHKVPVVCFGTLGCSKFQHIKQEFGQENILCSMKREGHEFGRKT